MNSPANSHTWNENGCYSITEKSPGRDGPNVSLRSRQPNVGCRFFENCSSSLTCSGQRLRTINNLKTSHPVVIIINAISPYPRPSFIDLINRLKIHTVLFIKKHFIFKLFVENKNYYALRRRILTRRSSEITS